MGVLHRKHLSTLLRGFNFTNSDSFSVYLRRVKIIELSVKTLLSLRFNSVKVSSPFQFITLFSNKNGLPRERYQRHEFLHSTLKKCH